jgi:RNA polymerase subunit RPABC4/transcription elongation factor Spt4
MAGAAVIHKRFDTDYTLNCNQCTGDTPASQKICEICDTKNHSRESDKKVVAVQADIIANAQYHHFA